MATVLIAWELGGGLGHLLPLVPLVRSLRENEHQVFVALRDLSQAASLYGEYGVSYLQAPFKTSNVGRRFDPPRTMAHILSNCGFGDDGELRALAEAWRNLVAHVRPDLIIFDHSPMALLASRDWPVRRVLTNNGFCCPPNTTPFPELCPWKPDTSEQNSRDEQEVLARANRVLAAWKAPPMERLAELYYPADEVFLMTFRELDHYPGREGATYWGAWLTPGGVAPQWPAGSGKRVYAYLKPFPARDSLLALLNDLGLPTLVYAGGDDPRLRDRFQSQTVQFSRERLDLARVGRECDLAILNGSHGSTASVLLSGRPILQIPVYFEHALTGVATCRLGAGLSAQVKRPEEIGAKLIKLIESDEYSQAAVAFATRYSDFSSEQQVERMANRLEEMLC